MRHSRTVVHVKSEERFSHGLPIVSSDATLTSRRRQLPAKWSRPSLPQACRSALPLARNQECPTSRRPDPGSAIALLESSARMKVIYAEQKEITDHAANSSCSPSRPPVG